MIGISGVGVWVNCVRIDTDKDGKLSWTEVAEHWSTSAEKITEEQARAVVAKGDTDGNEFLDFEEFKVMLRSIMKVVQV